MAQLGKNMKWTADPSLRPAMQKLFVDGLGATITTTTPGFERYTLSDGTHIGVMFGEALTPAQSRLAPWVELVVADVDQTRAHLVELGTELIHYDDDKHPYLAAPNGVVFRLASA